MDTFTQAVGIINEVDPLAVKKRHTKQFPGIETWIFQPEVDAACGNHCDHSSYHVWHLSDRGCSHKECE
jgi:hypothetical protein